MKGDWVSSELVATFSLRVQTHRGGNKGSLSGSSQTEIG
jgi:hypothetical protein